MVIVSACFLGVKCRYNGESVSYPWIEDWVKEGKAIALCPEVLGHLPIPRPPCEIQAFRVIDKCGEDQTEAFLVGAQKTLEIAKITNATMAILKSRSPSCGFGEIYDGNFSGKIVRGNGMTAELLSRHGIAIFNEDQEIEFKKSYIEKYKLEKSEVV